MKNEKIKIVKRIIFAKTKSLIIFICKNNDKIALIALLMFNFAMIKNNIDHSVEYLILLLMYLLAKLIKEITFSSELNFPRSKTRYTKVNLQGDIYVDKKNIQQMLIYLKDVEDFLEKRGINEYEK